MFGIILTITHIEIIQHEMISQIEVSSEEEEMQETRITRVKENCRTKLLIPRSGV